MKTKLFLTGFRGSGKTTLAKLLAKKLNFEVVEMDKLIVKRAGKSIAEITRDGKDWYDFRLLENQVLKGIIKKENIVVATGGGLFVNDVRFSTGLTHAPESPGRKPGDEWKKSVGLSVRGSAQRNPERKEAAGMSPLSFTFGEYNFNLVKVLPEKLIIFLKVTEDALRKRLKKGELENYNKKWRPSLAGDKNDFEENIKIYRQRLPLYEERADFVLDISNQTPEESVKEILKILKHENIIRY